VLEIADVPGLRPTSERIRETVFNWLTPRIAGARCLDLFAGTGALGLEALSRGAASVVFVEKSKRASQTLRSNVASLDVRGAVIVPGAANDYLGAAVDEDFDVVFLDPPFADDNLSELCRLIDESGLLASTANVYLEQDRAKTEPVLPDGWQVLKNKTAGNVRYMLVASGHRN
jgi:16S rRNA (guanine966-N2)-methyltransferase